MRNLFRSGAVFLILAGISFLAAAITTVKYLMTDTGSASAGPVVATGVMFFVIGLVMRQRNTKPPN